MPRWPKRTLLERLLAKTLKTDTCWLWQGHIDKRGYGRIGLEKPHEQDRCHRVGWRLHKGPIPDGLRVLHHCDVRNCWNPDHLFLGTQRDNVLDMHAKGRQAPKFGSFHGRAKLVEWQIKKIRKDKRSQSVIAKEYGVAQNTISRIKLKKNWSHVK